MNIQMALFLSPARRILRFFEAVLLISKGGPRNQTFYSVPCDFEEAAWNGYMWPTALDVQWLMLMFLFLQHCFVQGVQGFSLKG